MTAVTHKYPCLHINPIPHESRAASTSVSHLSLPPLCVSAHGLPMTAHHAYDHRLRILTTSSRQMIPEPKPGRIVTPQVADPTSLIAWCLCWRLSSHRTFGPAGARVGVPRHVERQPRQLAHRNASRSLRSTITITSTSTSISIAKQHHHARTTKQHHHRGQKKERFKYRAESERKKKTERHPSKWSRRTNQPSV